MSSSIYYEENYAPITPHVHPDAYSQPTSSEQHGGHGINRQLLTSVPYTPSNPEGMGPSIGGQSYSCLQKDEDFVKSMEVGSSHRHRIWFIWHLVLDLCKDNEGLARETLLQLLEGQDEEEDVWMWVEGDEESMTEIYMRRWPAPVPSDIEGLEELAGAAVAKRLERTRHGYSNSRGSEQRQYAEERRKRVQAVEPTVRFATIGWVVATSKAMIRADHSRGLRHRERFDLFRLIDDYYCALSMSPVLRDIIMSDYTDIALQSFQYSVARAGHTCHTTMYNDCKFWLGIQLLLHGTSIDDWPVQAPARVSQHGVTSFESHPTLKIDCTQCLARYKKYLTADATYVDESVHCPPSWLFMMGALAEGYTDPKGWLQWISKFSASHLALHTKYLDGEIRRLLAKRQPFKLEHKYLSWINFYPEECRESSTDIYDGDWKLAESIMVSSPIIRRNRGNTMSLAQPTDIRAFIGALFLSLLFEQLGSSTPAELFMQFLQDGPMEWLDELLPPLQPNNIAVANFRRCLRNSSHTCHDDVPQHLIDFYAASFSLLHKTNHVPFVILQSKDACLRKCVACSGTELYNSLIMGEEPRHSLPGKSIQVQIDILQQHLANIAAKKNVRFSLPDFEKSKNDNYVLYCANNVGSQERVGDAHEHVTKSSRVGPRTERRYPKKTEMVKKIKEHLINLLDEINIPSLGTSRKPILPWTTLVRLLSDRGWELDNWPSEVPLPGSGGDICDDNKGLHGLDLRSLRLLYDAAQEPHDHFRVGFRRISRSSETPGLNTRPVASGSRSPFTSGSSEREIRNRRCSPGPSQPQAGRKRRRCEDEDDVTDTA